MTPHPLAPSLRQMPLQWFGSAIRPERRAGFRTLMRAAQNTKLMS